MLCLLSVGLICFWGFHTYLLTFNYTTIEFLEKRGCNPPLDHVNRYDIGLWGNITSVLGANIVVWFFPFRCLCDGDGLAFKRTRRDTLYFSASLPQQQRSSCPPLPSLTHAFAPRSRSQSRVVSSQGALIRA